VVKAILETTAYLLMATNPDPKILKVCLEASRKIWLDEQRLALKKREQDERFARWARRDAERSSASGGARCSATAPGTLPNGNPPAESINTDKGPEQSSRDANLPSVEHSSRGEVDSAARPGTSHVRVPPFGASPNLQIQSRDLNPASAFRPIEESLVSAAA
jgi:hypothetical protein